MDGYDVMRAIVLCEELVPGAVFERGPRFSIQCSATAERKLRKLAREQAAASTLHIKGDDSGPVFVAGVKVAVRGS